VFPRLTQGTHDFAVFSQPTSSLPSRNPFSDKLARLHGLHGLRQITRSDNLDP
jgi:hypothetical protein